MDVSGVYANSITVTHVISGSGAEKAGIQPKDKLIKVNDLEIYGSPYDDILNEIRGEIGSTVTIVVDRDGQEISLEVERCTFANETVLSETYTIGSEKIGYVLITSFEEITQTQFESAVNALTDDGCQKFIFDVRNNTGGYLNAVVTMLDYLLPDGPIVTLKFSNGEEITYKSDSSCVNIDKAIVLTNGMTASAAELFTCALRDYNYAEIVGTKTYGKGCGQSFYSLSNGGVVKFTSFLYSPPVSENYDGVGIYPDVEVTLDPEYEYTNILLIEKENDAQFQAAIKLLTE